MYYEHKQGVILRKIESKDLPALLELKRESWWGTHKTLIINSDDQQHWYESIPQDQLYMIGDWIYARNCFTNEGGQLVTKDKCVVSVGVAVYTDIDWCSRSLRISGSIYKNQRKPEIIKAGFTAGLDFAFEVLNMQRVEAEVLEYHVTAQQLEIDYLGFTIEGRKRKVVYKCGRYYDSIMLGMLREEWQNHFRVKAYGDSCNLNFSHDKMEKLTKRFGKESEHST